LLHLSRLLDQVDVVLGLVGGEIGDQLVDLRLRIAGGPAGPLGQYGQAQAAEQPVGPPTGLRHVESGHPRVGGLLGLLRERGRLRLDLVHQSHGSCLSKSATWADVGNEAQKALFGDSSLTVTAVRAPDDISRAAAHPAR
jgi:hypothetical protein